MDKINRDELAKNDGKDGNRAYVAYEGKVYDVTDSKRWKDGKHMGRHEAGRDLTDQMSAAPHGPEVLERFDQSAVCDFPAEEKGSDLPPMPRPLARFYETFPMLQRHPHPFAVHFPIAFYAGALMFALLFLLTRNENFDSTAFYLVTLATIVAPITVLTGMQSWWLFYGLGRSTPLVVKLVGGPIVIVLGAVAVVLYVQNPNILLDGITMSWVYLGFMAAAFLGVMIVGYFGAKLTFPE